MEPTERQKLSERIRALLKRSDKHFQGSKYSDGKFRMNDAENDALIHQSNELLSDLEQLHRSDSPDGSSQSQAG